MYRILIPKYAGNSATSADFVFYTINSTIYESDSKDDAVQKYLSQIELYPKNSVFLTDVENPNLIVDSSPQLVNITSYRLTNDGHTFHVDVTTDLTTGVIYDFSATLFADLKAMLTEKGLTDITLTPWLGLNATNPTGTPISGVYLVPQGFLKIIDQTSQNTNITNKEYLFNI